MNPNQILMKRPLGWLCTFDYPNKSTLFYQLYHDNFCISRINTPRHAAVVINSHYQPLRTFLNHDIPYYIPVKWLGLHNFVLPSYTHIFQHIEET